MNVRKYYEDKFAAYPDVVCLNDFRVMLGGVCEKTALKILEQGGIKYFIIKRRHLIPKVCVIDYLACLDFVPKDIKFPPQVPGKRRKPGTGCLYQIHARLWEGKYSPRNAYGKRISRNVYAETKDACEKKLMVLIAQMDQEILAQKSKMLQTK